MPEKILVVDDDIDTLRSVGMMLQRQGYQIIAANNGHQALIMAQNEKPDLVLLDVMMPDLDGYDVTRRLRSNPATSGIPIIMFTAKTMVDDKVLGYEVGVDDYLTKPTQPRELFAHIKAVLARGKKAVPTVSTQAGLPKEHGYTIGVLAVKGGLGVSTVVLNLGIALRLRTRKEVIIAEYRPGEGSMALDLGYLHPEGLNHLCQRPLEEITLGGVEAELVTHKSEARILLASYNPVDVRLASQANQFEAITRQICQLAAFVVLDLGPALPPKTDKALPFCDELIIVLEPTPNAISRSQTLIDILNSKGFGEGRLTTILYNRQRTELQYTLTQVQQDFKHSIAQVFTPAPDLAFQSAKNSTPLIIQQPDNITSQQFFKLADSIIKRVRIRE